VRCEWDPRKQRTNLEKHGIQFADPIAVFDAVLAVTIPELGAGEDRFITMGLDGFGRLLSFVYTLRGEAVRIISARRATPSERRRYERDA
jgi:hypothetical protein